ncbi:MAG: 2-oxo acid dehydrogenase subunit E2 [Tissierellia bacterium]|nr:2-oxo acid dehydrogenase subunit E2 [Tissierellia bacterium]
MIKKRKDGHLVKMDPLFKLIPLIMETREDSQVFIKEEISIQAIDEYIKKKQEEGINLGYMHIFYSALVKTMKKRPKLNQFIMRGRLYRRDAITISLAVKKNMSLEGEETIVKVDFTGDESPEQIKEILNSQIQKEKDSNSEDNDMDVFVKVMDKIPQGFLRLLIKFLMYLDTINLMPYSLIKVSPFHASAFVTNMGSLGIDAINHHLYKFGTVGIFLAIGKKGRRIVEKKGKFLEEKTMTVAFVSDERVCDGFYYASALKQFFKYLRKPELLDEVEIIDEDVVNL